jgi:hypothetical protein
MDDLTQTYTPVNAGEQTLVFATMQMEAATNPGYPSSHPLTMCSCQIRDDTEGVNYATDFVNPSIAELNATQTFAMAVKDNNQTSASWVIRGREPNDTGRDVNIRNARVVILGLLQND